ncbi:phage terminase large subunit family protein [Bartonella sp. DGB2]|uniref:phage terminase large subunit family protein n=1 Tax=Bartonella sp. DGB2 TaxID=3388426 RepID=UPI00398FCC2F
MAKMHQTKMIASAKRQAKNLARVAEALAEGFRPDPAYTVSQWADIHRYLSTEASAEAGLWRTSRTPYLREIMDNLSSYSSIETTVVMKGAQIGMSEAALNFCGYAIHHSPGPILYVMPTVDMAKKLSKMRVEHMIRNSKALSERIAPPRARDSGNTLFMKEFAGGSLNLTGANSAVGLRSMSIRYLVLDEVDGYPINVDGEGDPVTLALRRTASYPRRKVFMLSTPASLETSRIKAEFEKGDQRYYNVVCEDCHELQPITWAQIRWPEDKPEEAHFFCAHCGAIHEEHRKAALLSEANGARWVATKQSRYNNFRSYHLSALYSPWFTWGECARAFLEAKSDPATLQSFVNTVLGEPWEERQGAANDATKLYALREEYELLPPQVALLTCGVDVQPDRLELELVGWGRGEESWNIDYKIIQGNPSEGRVWERLDGYLDKRWPHPAFQEKGGMKIHAICVDTGGSNTQAVYDYVRDRENRRIWGVKGKGGSYQVWPKRPSRKNKGKINLYNVGVDAAKDMIMARLNKVGAEACGSGACHFHKDRDLEYFEQLTAEYKKIVYRDGRKKYAWVKAKAARNEALDCRVYAYAALKGLLAEDVDLTAEADWIAEFLSCDASREKPAIKIVPTPYNALCALRRPLSDEPKKHVKKGLYRGW